MKRKTIMILIIIILGVVLFTTFYVYPLVLKGFYPNKYSEFVKEYSKKYDIEEEWIYALIKAESNFKKDSISQSGAIGLMQLMESTAKEVSKEIGIDELDLKNAEINIELGTKYFANLIKYYKREL